MERVYETVSERPCSYRLVKLTDVHTDHVLELAHAGTPIFRQVQNVRGVSSLQETNS